VRIKRSFSTGSRARLCFSRDKRGINEGVRRSYLCGRVKNAVSTGSFEELAIPLFDQLYNFAQWMTHNREGAEDLVQKTFAKALKSFPSFRIGTNFRAWMYRILPNTFLTSCTGLKAPMTVPLNLDEDGVEMSVQRDTRRRFYLSG
jgi:DNA-directed RNA polymerase specialized sigma24 family protein